MHDGAPRLTFFWRRQWKMKMNIPCRVLKMVKRYAITMEESLRKSRPKDQVSPSRQRRTNAPDTHDLWNTGDPDERAQRRTFLLLLVKKKKGFSHQRAVHSGSLFCSAASRNSWRKEDNFTVASSDDGRSLPSPDSDAAGGQVRVEPGC